MTYCEEFYFSCTILSLIGCLIWLLIWLSLAAYAHQYQWSTFPASFCSIFWFSTSTSFLILMVCPNDLRFLEGQILLIVPYMATWFYLLRFFLSSTLDNSCIYATPYLIFLEPFWGRMQISIFIVVRGFSICFRGLCFL